MLNSPRQRPVSPSCPERVGRVEADFKYPERRTRSDSAGAYVRHNTDKRRIRRRDV